MFKTALLPTLLLFAATNWAQAFETKAPQAILIDADTNTILFEKNADKKSPPSSMTKIMTAYIAFDRLTHGDVELTDTLPVSEKAWRKGGSKMFVQVGDNVSLSDLLNGILVQSGNDACIVVAEGLSGSEDSFAEEMTLRAHEMGATNSTFLNSTGWPAEGHVSTCRDLATISARTIKEFPKLYEDYYGTIEFTYNNIKQGNRNPLLYESGFVADGLKTGHTEVGGYGLASSALKDGRRLILVINGLKTSKDRKSTARELLTWGFNEFKNVEVSAANQVMATAQVWGGAEPTVPLIAKEDVEVTVQRRDQKGIESRVVYDSPLQAPLKAGQEVGYVAVERKGKELKRFPLYTAQAVEEAGFIKRILNSIKHLFVGSPANG